LVKKGEKRGERKKIEKETENQREGVIPHFEKIGGNVEKR
jgi:hypothetical protein